MERTQETHTTKTSYSYKGHHIVVNTEPQTLSEMKGEVNHHYIIIPGTAPIGYASSLDEAISIIDAITKVAVSD